jgi:hypothetical protein
LILKELHENEEVVCKIPLNFEDCAYLCENTFEGWKSFMAEKYLKDELSGKSKKSVQPENTQKVDEQTK